MAPIKTFDYTDRPLWCLSVPSVKIGVITLSFRCKQVSSKKLHSLTLMVIIIVTELLLPINVIEEARFLKQGLWNS